MKYKQELFGRIFLILTFLVVLCIVTVEAQDWSQLGSNADDVLIAAINSLAPVQNNPSNPSTFYLPEQKNITLIRTFHWNYGRGKDLGLNGMIMIYNDRNEIVERLPVTYLETKDGVQNVYWVASGPILGNRSGKIRGDLPPLKNITLGPGMYTISDSDPSTWSQNEETRGKGIFFVYALK